MWRIQHARGENEVFASPGFEEKDVIESYYSSLAYRDLGRELQSKERYGERYMEVKAQ